MIIGTITALAIIFGGGAGFSMDIFRDAVKNHVADKDRQEQVIDLTKAFDNEMKDLANHINKRDGEVKVLVANYDATRAEYETFFETDDWRRDKAVERILDFRFKAKDLMTAEEWQAVYQEAVGESSKKSKKD